MTNDISARLRDVLSNSLLDKLYVTPDPLTHEEHQAARYVLIEALLPAVSSLLEEREREILQSAIEAIQDDRNENQPLREWSGMSRAIFAIERIRDSRLASSSSPAAPQEQK